MTATDTATATGATRSKVRLGVWKLASCDGCQLLLLDARTRLLDLSRHVEIVHFDEATTAENDDGGRIDLSLVEGSVSTDGDLERVREIRRRSDVLVTIGACATAGGIQALRNPGLPNVPDPPGPRPDLLRVLPTSTPVADHVEVDAQLHGCPIDRGQLVELIGATLVGRRPYLPGHAVCVDCKRRGLACVLVAEGAPCLGPVTRSGCDALCPAVGRACYGCFGPADGIDAEPLARHFGELGFGDEEVARIFATFNAAAPEFARVSGHPPAGRS